MGNSSAGAAGGGRARAAPAAAPDPVRSTVVRALAALAVFAAAHSALAARPTKRAVRAAVGREAADGLYRPAYVAVAVVARAGFQLQERGAERGEERRRPLRAEVVAGPLRHPVPS